MTAQASEWLHVVRNERLTNTEGTRVHAARRLHCNGWRENCKGEMVNCDGDISSQVSILKKITLRCKHHHYYKQYADAVLRV